MPDEEEESSTFFNNYKNKTKVVHNEFLAPNIEDLFTRNSNPDSITFEPGNRNEIFDSMINNKTRHNEEPSANINNMSVFAFSEKENGDVVSTGGEGITVHKKCIDSIFSPNPNPSSYIAVEKPRLNLNDNSTDDDQYPKTLFEDIIKNSHDARNTRILSSQFEACVPIDTSGFAGDDDVPKTTYVSVIEAAEMKYLGRHPDQLRRVINGFTLEKSIVAKSFVPIFLTFMLLLLFSKKK